MVVGLVRWEDEVRRFPRSDQMRFSQDRDIFGREVGKRRKDKS